MDHRNGVDGLPRDSLLRDRKCRHRREGDDAYDTLGAALRFRRRGKVRARRRVDTTIDAPNGATADNDEEENPDDPPHARYASTGSEEYVLLMRIARRPVSRARCLKIELYSI